MSSNPLDYYNVGTADAPVVSASSLHALDPTEGGSIKKFLLFFSDKEEEKDSLSLKKGKLLHRYIEHSNDFAVADVTRPTEMLGDLTDEFLKNLNDVKISPEIIQGIDITITSELKTDKARSAEIHEANDGYSKLAEKLQVQKDVVIACLRKARYKGNFYSSYVNESKVVAKVIDGSLEYIESVRKAEGKIMLTPKEKESIDGAISSLYNNKKIKELLHLDNSYSFEGMTEEIIYKEVPIYWQEKVEVLGNESYTIRINCKGKLDQVTVNFVKGIVKIIDLKSLSGSIYTYQSSFEYYRTYRQLSFYTRAVSQWFKAMFPDKDISKFKLEIYIPVVETIGLFQSGIYVVDNPWLFKGKEEYKHLLKRYAWHKYTGEMELSYEEATNNGLLTFKSPEVTQR